MLQTAVHNFLSTLQCCIMKCLKLYTKSIIITIYIKIQFSTVGASISCSQRLVFTRSFKYKQTKFYYEFPVARIICFLCTTNLDYELLVIYAIISVVVAASQYNRYSPFEMEMPIFVMFLLFNIYINIYVYNKVYM